MSHFAKVVDGIVTQVIVADEEFFVTFVDNSPGEWIRTSYNTIGGVHQQGGEPLRKNFAGVGFSYDKTRDAFIPPKPFESWTLDEETCLWVAPVPQPESEEIHFWNEESKQWIPITQEQV